MDPTPAEKLFATVEFAPNGCWLWTGKTKAGYGRVSINGRTHEVHRLAYEMMVGPIPAGLHLDHLCHTNDLSCPGGKTCLHRRWVDG